MAVVKTLAYNDTATITAEKSFMIQALLGRKWRGKKISYLKNLGMAEAEVFIEPVVSVIKLYMSAICERS